MVPTDVVDSVVKVDSVCRRAIVCVDGRIAVKSGYGGLVRRLRCDNGPGMELSVSFLLLRTYGYS